MKTEGGIRYQRQLCTINISNRYDEKYSMILLYHPSCKNYFWETLLQSVFVFREWFLLLLFFQQEEGRFSDVGNVKFPKASS